MSDQNRFDEYKKKALEYWGLFLNACAVLWGRVKVNAGKAAVFLRHHGKRLAQKLAAYALAVREWLGNATKSLRRNIRRLAQKLAAFALKVREEIQNGALTQRVKTWFAAVTARFSGGKAEEIAEPAQKAQPVQELPVAEPAPEVKELPQPAQPKAIAAQPRAENTAAGDDRTLAQKAKPYLLEVGAFFGVIGMCVKFIVKWIWKLRKLIMAAPVVWAAVKLAMENMDRLPENVGLDIQATGEFAQMITRNEAVYWPLGITLFCLLLMFCAKKPLLPWVISIFTLVMPWLIWLTNYYA